MQNVFRRPSGIWVARLAVPARLRQAIGRHEFVQSTQTTDLTLAKLVSSALIAGWRRALMNADRAAGRLQMALEDETLLRIIEGNPALIGANHLPLQAAAEASGIGLDDLLRHVASGEMQLWIRHASAPGYLLPYIDLPIDDVELGSRIVPAPANMPDSARRERVCGVLPLLPADAQTAANAWLTNPSAALTFHLLDWGQPGWVFAHDETPELTLTASEVAVRDVEQLRHAKAGRISAQAVERARAAIQAQTVERQGAVDLKHTLRPIRESVEMYLRDAGRLRGDEQQDRVRRACEVFLALMGPDLTGAELDRDLLRTYRDNWLPTFPEHEDKLLRQHRPGPYVKLADMTPEQRMARYRESVELARHVGWPGMSAAQRTKTFGFLCGWIKWLGQERWAGADVAAGLADRGEAVAQVARERKAKQDSQRRDPFTSQELGMIFGAEWFKTGRGTLTKAGTYYEWSPVRTFLPLLGLLTGARLNEICQLQLTDLRKNEYGVWLLAVTTNEFDDPADDMGIWDEAVESNDAKPDRRKLKNAQSRRAIPVHSELIRMGLVEYAAALKAAGYSRLFPELKFDNRKGYGKAASRWFNDAYLGRDLGIPRNGRKVFHSFRHNVATTVKKDLRARPVARDELLGHVRGKGESDSRYGKDLGVAGPESELVMLIEGLRHQFLADLAPVDVQAGLQAVGDALRRKANGRGAVED